LRSSILVDRTLGCGRVTVSRARMPAPHESTPVLSHTDAIGFSHFLGEFEQAGASQ
jgi:hypothetical protein